LTDQLFRADGSITDLHRRTLRPQPCRWHPDALRTNALYDSDRQDQPGDRMKEERGIRINKRGEVFVGPEIEPGETFDGNSMRNPDGTKNYSHFGPESRLLRRCTGTENP
jgi:hypothetical protein